MGQARKGSPPSAIRFSLLGRVAIQRLPLYIAPPTCSATTSLIRAGLCCEPKLGLLDLSLLQRLAHRLGQTKRSPLAPTMAYSLSGAQASLRSSLHAQEERERRRQTSDPLVAEARGTGLGAEE